MKKKVTIEDIAQNLGVSKSSVSLALSDRYGVSEEKRAKILLAAHEMGFDFSKIKKRTQKTKKKLGLVIEYKSFISESFWSEIIIGIEKEALKSDAELEVVVYNKNTNFELLTAEILKKNLGGLIFIFRYGNELLQKITDFNVPIVLVEPQFYLGLEYSQILPTNYIGGYEVAEFFMNTGHKKLAIYGNIKHGYSFLQRYNGFRDYILRQGQAELVEIVNCDDGERPGDKKLLRQVFSAEDCPTALFCSNDMLAFQAYEEFREIGLSIPGDVSVIGFDNVKESKYLSPSLSTVDIQKERMGALAVEHLMKQISGQNRQPLIIHYPTKLIIRESVLSKV